MGIIADKIDWFRNGERANSDNFNRPLEQLVNEIETRLINEDGSITSSSSKQVFNISEKGNIDNGNIVYMDVSGKIEKAIADGSEKSKALGVAVIANNLDGQETLSVVSSGVVKVTNKVLEIGRVYYLSNNVEGDYSTTPSDVMIGIALKTDLLLVSIQGAVAGTGGTTLQNIRYIVSQGDPNSPQKITELTVAGVDKKPQQISLNGTVLNPERYTFQDGELRFVDSYVVYGDILTITISI